MHDWNLIILFHFQADQRNAKWNSNWSLIQWRLKNIDMMINSNQKTNYNQNLYMKCELIQKFEILYFLHLSINVANFSLSFSGKMYKFMQKCVRFQFLDKVNFFFLFSFVYSAICDFLTHWLMEAFSPAYLRQYRLKRLN